MIITYDGKPSYTVSIMEFRDDKVARETQYFADPFVGSRMARSMGGADGVNRCATDLVPGAVFPDYQLPDHTGTPRRLSELQGDDPLILTLSRGHYCPKEHQQHLDLAAFYPKIAVAYTQIATISTDDHHTLQEFRASVGAQWTFLSDPERTVQKDLDIAEYTDPEHNPMIPHTLVLKPGLIIHSIYNGYWFWGRPSVVDLWHDLRAVTSEIRPDWDLRDSRTPRGLERGRLLGLPWMEQGSKSV